MKKSTKGNNLSVFLAIGESIADFQAKGQLSRLLDYNVSAYLEDFEKVYIYSYKNEKAKLPKNCILIPNKYNLPRFVYSILLPLLSISPIKKCSAIRSLQLTGGIPALICKYLYKIPYVINYGYDYEYYAKIDKKYLHAFIYKILKFPILKNSSAVIVTSKYISSKLGFLDKKKLMFLPNGVDLKRFKKFNQKRSTKQTKIVFIGRLEQQKNLSNLVTACANLKYKYQLLLYGSGKLKTSLIAQAWKQKVNLKVCKPVTYSEIPQILNSADIFVLPSQVEGNPKILLEAMACQCKIVATSVPGIRELITDNVNGYLCNIDPVSISAALQRAWASEDNVGSNARKVIEKSYDIDLLLKKEAQLLANIK